MAEFLAISPKKARNQSPSAAEPDREGEMSAPAVKPVLPAPSAGSQGPANTQSPLKNHTGTPLSVPISLVQEKSPDKAKESVANAVSKPTPNGVEAPKALSPTVKTDEVNHVPTPAPPAPTVSPPTTAPTKVTPEKTLNHSPSTGASSTTPPKSGVSSNNVSPPVPVPPVNAAHVTLKASSTSPAITDEKEKEKEKSNAPSESTSSPVGSTSSKRGGEKVDKVEKVEKAEKVEKTEKDKTGTPPRGKRKRESALSTPENDDSSKAKRTRVPVQPYQSPMPDLFSPKPRAKSPEPKEKEKDSEKEKLVIFYKNEFLAVRNSEGSFYVCQALQNVYKSSHKIKIRWLSQQDDEKSADGTIYSPDFYDTTDFDCILTSLRLQRVDKNKFKLSTEENLRTENILQRALNVEKGLSEKPDITEEHPDGLDLSLFKDEAQLKKRKNQAKASSRPKRVKPSKVEKKADKPKVELKKPVAVAKKTPAKKIVSPRSFKKSTKAPVKTPVIEKKAKEEKQAVVNKRAERASLRDKAKEKTPVKRKAESISSVPSKIPKTTPRAAAASAKKAAAAAAKTPTLARKPPTRGRRGEAPEPEPSTSGRGTKSRNVRSSSPVVEKIENVESKKESSEPSITSAADNAPATTASVPSVDPAVATSPPAAPDATSDGSVSAPVSDNAATPDGEASTTEASRNRGGKKPTASSPAKKA